ncbi:MAG TPA: beta-L-arabinofuranosidase domain-containing protein, partial [Anaerolineales bacterium]|nr:beta-L-arabinofuranosidase domain-containing protein [Anaerolineales bacterium]
MFVVNTTHSPQARLRPVSVNAVTLTDEFWAPRLQSLREVTLPTQLAQIEQTGRLDNFRHAAGWVSTPRKGFVYDDSDVYKWLEAVFWSSVHRNAFGRSTVKATEVATTSLPGEFEQRVDGAIEAILAAQQPDGYLNTAFMDDKAAQRWTNLRDLHELYCAGHFIQAAITHYRTTADEKLLTAALRLSDLICTTFGLAEQGKIPGVPGHQEIEIALVELYRLTRDLKYLEQAQYFLDARGRGLIGGNPYHQDHKPYRTLTRHAGHAVRALYMNIAAADLYLETGDPTLLETLTRLWVHATSRQMYITGGFGARHSGESFGDDYELPNGRAYAETCAAIASVMWNYRMVILTCDARYTDLLEHTLYNAVLPGLSADAQHYFYVNPLANDGGDVTIAHRRQPWFPCACCPPNLARLLASLPCYFYSLSDDNALWIHLYADNTVNLTLPDSMPLTLEVRTSYPWQGDITLTTRGAATFALHLRLPGWCPDPTLTLNGSPLDHSLTPGTYHKISRTWTDGDSLTLHLPMPVRILESHPAVAENTGKIAFQRGPVLYCLESADNPGNLDDLYFDPAQPPTTQHHPDLLGGLTTLHFPAQHRPPTHPWNNHLYRPLTPHPPTPHLLTATAI